MRRLLLIVLTVVACVPAAPAAAAAPDPPTTNTTISASVAASERPSALPRPNSGQKPTQAGDRGGALQYATFALMCAGLAFIAFRIVSSSRRARRRLEQTNA
ncbi:MAG: hypothetical protein ABJD24_07575 [Acidimicrobiales bacterium]